jgi:hypothetical protein
VGSQLSGQVAEVLVDFNESVKKAVNRSGFAGGSNS